MLDGTIGFIGAGKMATALARGWIAEKLVDTTRLVAHDALAAAADEFSGRTGARRLPSNAAVAAAAKIVVLAVKPQHATAALAELRPALSADHLLVSIAAGVSTATLDAQSGGGARIIRVMPNTPCLVGAGASAYCLGPRAIADDARLIESLLSAVGKVERVDEKLMDAVTGLSGSGPAFVYTVIEALSDGGVRVGLPRGVATTLAAQTVLGAARMVLETGEHTAVLRDQVTSPGGTTIAGIEALESRGLRAALVAAVVAATRRAAELGAS